MGDPQSVSVASLAFPETMVHPRPAPTPQKKHGKCASPTWPAGNLRLEKALLLFGSFRLGARLNLEVSTHGVAPKWIVYSGKAWKPPKKLGVPPFQEISIGLLTRAKNHFWFYARGMPCHAHPGLLETSVDLKGHIPRLYSSFLAWAGTFVGLWAWNTHWVGWTGQETLCFLPFKNWDVLFIGQPISDHTRMVSCCIRVSKRMGMPMDAPESRCCTGLPTLEKTPTILELVW